MTPQEQARYLFASPADRAGFSQLVYQIVRSIPAGRVMSYGAIARLIPAPNSIDPLAYRRIRARWVGYALADCPGDVPWQRVVNQQGSASRRNSGSHQLQIALLKEEGAPMQDATHVDMAKASWEPTDDVLADREKGDQSV